MRPIYSALLLVLLWAMSAVPTHAAYPPASWSLASYIVRVHNQGSSNSCVAQTLSTIMEIEVAEFATAHPQYAARHRYYKRWTAFSAASIYNPLDYGSKYAWLSYERAFGLAVAVGIAPLDTFNVNPNIDWWTQPTPRARHFALHHRFAWWKYLGTWDRTGIEYEIRAGHPLAVLMPVYSSFYDNWSGAWPVFSWFSGYYLYDHMMTIVGYGPTGVTVLNSWGSGWGFRGLATISWSALRTYGRSVAAAYLKDPRTIPR